MLFRIHITVSDCYVPLSGLMAPETGKTYFLLTFLQHTFKLFNLPMDRDHYLGSCQVKHVFGQRYPRISDQWLVDMNALRHYLIIQNGLLPDSAVQTLEQLYNLVFADTARFELRPKTDPMHHFYPDLLGKTWNGWWEHLLQAQHDPRLRGLMPLSGCSFEPSPSLTKEDYFQEALAFAERLRKEAREDLVGARVEASIAQIRYDWETCHAAALQQLLTEMVPKMMGPLNKEAFEEAWRQDRTALQDHLWKMEETAYQSAWQELEEEPPHVT